MASRVAARTLVTTSGCSSGAGQFFGVFRRPLGKDRVRVEMNFKPALVSFASRSRSMAESR